MLVACPSVEDATNASLLERSAELLNAGIILVLLLHVQDSSFVEIKGLSKELLPHLSNDKVATILHRSFGVDRLFPSVHALLQISPEADLHGPCGSSSSRSYDLILLLFDFLVQTVNFSLHLSSFFLHLHHGHFLHHDVLLVLALLPQVKRLALSLMESSDHHVFQVLVDSNILICEDFLPVEEVAGHVSIEVVPEAVEPSVLARSNCYIGLLLDLFVKFFHGRVAVSFKGLLHKDELLFLLVLSEGVEATFQQPGVAILLEAQY